MQPVFKSFNNLLRPRLGLMLGVITTAFGSLPASAQIAPPSPATLPQPLSLQNAIAIALHLQPQQYIAKTSTQQAIGQKEQAAAQYYPTLTPTYSYQNSSNALYGVPAGSYSFQNPTTGTTSTTTTGTTTTAIIPTNEVTVIRGGGLSVALSQTLFDGGQRELANAEARHAVDAARYGEADTRQQTVLAVTQDYYDLLQSLDLVKVAKAQVSRYQQTVDLTKAQVEAGTVAAINVYQAQADLSTAQVTLLQDQNSVTTASSNLKNAMGVESNDVVQPALLAEDDQLPPLPAQGEQQTLDDCVRIAYANRPDLRQQQFTVQSSDEAVKTAQINAGLTVSSTLAVTYQATNDVGYRGLDTELLFTGSYPLFDAGKARGEVAVAKAQRDATIDQLTLLRQTVRTAVEQAYSTRAETYQAAQLAQAAVHAAQVNYDSAIESRKEGVDSILDVTTAQTTLTQAQDQYVTAVYQFYIADANLQRALGRG